MSTFCLDVWFIDWCALMTESELSVLLNLFNLVSYCVSIFTIRSCRVLLSHFGWVQLEGIVDILGYAA